MRRCGTGRWCEGTDLEVLYATDINLLGGVWIQPNQSTHIPHGKKNRDIHTFRQRSVIVVQQLLAVKRLQTLQHPEPDPPSPNRADDLVLQVVRVPRDLGHVPVTALDHLVCGDKVADEEEDAHHDVLCDGHDVRAGHLEHLDPVLDRGVEVDVVGPDARGDAELEVLGLLDQVACEVAGVEGGGDEDLCLWRQGEDVSERSSNVLRGTG